MRLLAGILAAQPFRSRLIGDASLSKRPMKRVIEPLAAMGATINAEGPKDCAAARDRRRRSCSPSNTSCRRQRAGEERDPARGHFAKGKTTSPSRARAATTPSGCSSTSSSARRRTISRVSILGEQTPESRDFAVPGDISSAAFWLVAAAAQPQLAPAREERRPQRNAHRRSRRARAHGRARPRSHRESRRPSRAASIEMRGARLKGTDDRRQGDPERHRRNPDPRRRRRARAGHDHHLRRRRIAGEGNRPPRRDRHESSRHGRAVAENEDGLEIIGGAPLRARGCESFGDHRIAMAFAIAGLFAEGETIIEDRVRDTSYPGFLRDARTNPQGHRASTQTPVITSLSLQTAPVNTATSHTSSPSTGPPPQARAASPARSRAGSSFIYVNTGAMYRAITWLRGLARRSPRATIAGAFSAAQFHRSSLRPRRQRIDHPHRRHRSLAAPRRPRA